MHARVDAALTLELRELSPKLLERLIGALSFPSPASRLPRPTGRFASSEPETLCVAEQIGQELRLPRGSIHLLRRLAADDGHILTCDDQRVLPAEQLAPMAELPLRGYQAAAVDKLAIVTQGTVVIPCGGGKTRCALGAIARLRTPTLILVHTLDLADQWLAELRNQLQLNPALIGGGEQGDAPVTVAVVQALARWEQVKLEAFLRRFGLLVIDEAHHMASSTFHRVVNRCPARYRLALTATPEREDGLTALLDLFVGNPLLVVTHEQLVADGVLTVPQICTLETDFDFPYDSIAAYASLLNAVADDDARNRQIVAAVAAEARAGHSCLVLSGRIDHCHRLAEALQAAGVSVAVLTSQVKRKRRKELLDQARAGELSVLIATSLADEGLDLPRLSRVFLAFPGKARARTVQRLGRLMRPHADKRNAILFDVVDRKVAILRRHHMERRRQYAEVLGIPASKLARGKKTAAA